MCMPLCTCLVFFLIFLQWVMPKTSNTKEGTDDRKSVNTCNLSSSGWWLEARGQLSGAGNKGARRVVHRRTVCNHHTHSLYRHASCSMSRSQVSIPLHRAYPVITRSLPGMESTSFFFLEKPFVTRQALGTYSWRLKYIAIIPLTHYRNISYGY